VDGVLPRAPNGMHILIPALLQRLAALLAAHHGAGADDALDSASYISHARDRFAGCGCRDVRRGWQGVRAHIV
jgi:hypothetical protein